MTQFEIRFVTLPLINKKINISHVTDAEKIQIRKKINLIVFRWKVVITDILFLFAYFCAAKFVD